MLRSGLVLVIMAAGVCIVCTMSDMVEDVWYVDVWWLKNVYAYAVPETMIDIRVTRIDWCGNLMKARHGNTLCVMKCACIFLSVLLVVCGVVLIEYLPSMYLTSGGHSFSSYSMLGGCGGRIVICLICLFFASVMMVVMVSLFIDG